MSYNQAHGKMNKSENKPVEKQLPGKERRDVQVALTKLTLLHDGLLRNSKIRYKKLDDAIRLLEKVLKL